MGRSSTWIPYLTVASCVFAAVTSTAQQPAPSAAASASLDFEYFRTKVQPIFLAKREGHARCIACHSAATGMRLEPIPAGSATWDEAAARKNFDTVRRMVVPGS